MIKRRHAFAFAIIFFSSFHNQLKPQVFDFDAFFSTFDIYGTNETWRQPVERMLRGAQQPVSSLRAHTDRVLKAGAHTDTPPSGGSFSRRC